MNTMQSETAEFAPVPPPDDLNQTTLSDVRLVQAPGELETYASSLIQAYSLHIWKHDVIHKTGST